MNREQQLFERCLKLAHEKQELLEACKEMAKYLEGNENVRNMQGPEYGIWHRAMARIEKAEGRE